MADNNYPRLLKLDTETEEELRSFLNQEILQTRAERQKFLTQLKEYQEIYWSEPKKEKNTFPFTGASNLVIPLAAISIETIHARNMTTLFGMDQFVQIKAKKPEWVPVERDFERFFDDQLRNKMKIWNFAADTDLERVKYGNCIGRVTYIQEKKTAIREVNGKEQEITVITKEGPVAEAVSVSRFVMPFTDSDPQSARWCGEEHTKTPFEVEQLERNGFFAKGTSDKLRTFFDTPTPPASQTGYSFQRKQEELEKKEPILPYYVDFYEIWLSFNTDKDPAGKTKELVVHYHYETGTFMAIRYNWFDDLRRPYRIGKYFPIEHRWTGVGVCKQLTDFQKEITVQHRQRIDNATLANTRMIKINKLSGYGPKEPIFPGKMWFVDEMDHIDIMQMGDVYNSSYNNEQASLQYAQQRSGVNDQTLGSPQVGTPDTATADLTKVQESTKKFDYFFKNLKSFMNEIVIDTACIMHQFGPRDVSIVQQDPDYGAINNILKLPESQIRDGLFFDIKTIGQTDNKLVDRQNWIQIAQILQQYYNGIMELAQGTGNPQLAPQYAQKALEAATEAMREILTAFDVRNIEKILLLNPNVTPNQPPVPGVSGGTQNNIQAPGGGNIAQMLQQFGRPGGQGLPQLQGAR